MVQRHIRIRMVTWNTYGVSPTGFSVTHLTGIKCDNTDADIICIGLQEVKFVFSSFYSESTWILFLRESLSKLGYFEIASKSSVNISISVYTKFDLIPYISNISTSLCASTRLFMRGKGAVAIRMQCFERKICLVTCHMTSYEENIEQRVEDCKYTIENLKFSTSDSSKYLSLLDHDVILWSGDFNFRLYSFSIDLCRNDLRQYLITKFTAGNEVDKKSTFKLFSSKHDQLSKMFDQVDFLKPFFENEINFPPTYKYDLGTCTFDTSEKQRFPAWTDRIIYNKKNRDVCELYTSIHNFSISDHKPVFAIFKLNVYYSAIALL